MSQREKWIFRYEVQRLTLAAKDRATHERGREAWWNTEYEAAAVKAKDAGFEVREYDVTGGKNAQIVVDVSLQGRLNECSQKRAAHRAAAEQYEQWWSIFAAQDITLTFDLDSTDVLYFGLGAP